MVSKYFGLKQANFENRMGANGVAGLRDVAMLESDCCPEGARGSSAKGGAQLARCLPLLALGIEINQSLGYPLAGAAEPASLPAVN